MAGEARADLRVGRARAGLLGPASRGRASRSRWTARAVTRSRSRAISTAGSCATITEIEIPDAAETPRRQALEDHGRIDYLRAHLEALAALADGADIRRYFVWSLLDSFEWELGYGARFGLVHVDVETQRRAIKRSARWYRDFITRARSDAAH